MLKRRGPAHRPLAWLLLALALLGTVVANDTSVATQTVWDAGFRALMRPFPDTGVLSIENVDMLRMLLYPPSSDLSFLPAAYQTPAVLPATLRLTNSSITTHCSTVQGYATWLTAIFKARGTNTSGLDVDSMQNIIHVHQLSWSSQSLSVTLEHVYISCTQVTASRQAAMATASNSTELLATMEALSQLNISAGSAVQLSGAVSISPAAGWPSDGILFSSGPLYLFSAPGTRAVLDLNMDQNVINVTSAVHLENITLVNLCTPLFVVQGYLMYTSYLLSAIGRPSYPWGTGIRTLYVRNSTIVVPREEVWALMYWTAMHPSPFAALRPYASVFTRSYPNSPPVAAALDPHRLVVQLDFNTVEFDSVTMQSADVPPEEARNVTLQQPMQCGGAGETKQPLGTVNGARVLTLSPLFAATSSEQLADALSTATHQQFMFPPMFMLFQNATLNPAQQQLSFAMDMMIVGPTGRGAAVGNPSGVVLDMRSMTAGAIALVGRTYGLYLQRVTLNLAGAPTHASDRTGANVLPLWAIQADRGNVTRVNMDSVTVILPLESFGSMYALAKSGGPRALADARAGATAPWRSLLDPSLDNFTEFIVSRFDVSGIAVTSFSGWGAAGSNVLLLPASPYVDDQPRIIPPGASAVQPSPSDSIGLSTTAIILIAVLGGAGVLAVIALLFIYRYHRNRREREREGEGECEVSNSGELPKAAAGKEASLTACAAQRDHTVCEPSSSERVTGGNTPSGGSGYGNSKGFGLDSGQQVSLDTNAVSVTWDPMKEVQQMAGTVQSKGEDQLQLLEPIGTGGFGTVYRGRWRNLDVAVKTVLFTSKQGAGDSPEKQVIKEAAVCSTVIHPNVVATYHYDIRPVRTIPADGPGMHIQDPVHPSDWKMYLVQELCHASLADALVSSFFHNKSSGLPYLDLILHTLDDVAAGLDYIHSKNIIHGDLKPENVLLKVEPGKPHGIIGKVTDFGLCSTMDPSKSHVSCFNGTPFYAAPEIASTGKATKASDVFSLGVLMVEVYRRVPPWVHSAQGYQANETFLVFTERAPAAYLALIDQCLNRDPKKRPDLAQIRVALKSMISTLLVRPAGSKPASEQVQFSLSKPGRSAQPAAAAPAVTAAAAPADAADAAAPAPPQGAEKPSPAMPLAEPAAAELQP